DARASANSFGFAYIPLGNANRPSRVGWPITKPNAATVTKAIARTRNNIRSCASERMLATTRTYTARFLNQRFHISSTLPLTHTLNTVESNIHAVRASSRVVVGFLSLLNRRPLMRAAARATTDRMNGIWSEEPKNS